MNQNVKNLTKIAILGAVAFVLMLFEFPLPIAPVFYKLDLSEIAPLIGGFAMGPMAAFVIEAVKIILKLMFRGTTTAFVGEIANFLVGSCFAASAAYIYHLKKSKQSALVGMLVGTIVMAIAGALMNIFVLIPLYSSLYDLPIENIVKMGSAIFSSVNDVNSLVLFCVVPFNMIKGLLVSIITFILYKSISPILHS
ncbi:MAG: ECF transporter S component [Solobacterium sp.]|nr:ECF transporter S component [Solobacterium sp.]